MNRIKSIIIITLAACIFSLVSFGQTNKSPGTQISDSIANGSSISNNIIGRDTIPGSIYNPGNLNSNPNSMPGINQNTPAVTPNTPPGVAPGISPNLPDNQNILNTPGSNPNTPGINNSPDLLNPTLPTTPGTPGMPTTPGSPILPNNPTTPGIPGNQTTPGMPNTPMTPGAPGSIPGSPATIP